MEKTPDFLMDNVENDLKENSKEASKEDVLEQLQNYAEQFRMLAFQIER